MRKQRGDDLDTRIVLASRDERLARVDWRPWRNRFEQRDKAVSLADTGCDDPTITHERREVDDRAKDELE
jgi:hypothetical protein